MSTAKYEIIVLDIDGAIVEQKKLLEVFNPTIISLQHRHAELRNWCPLETIDDLKSTITAAYRTDLPKFFLYGSGDFHHFPLLFSGLLNPEEPITIIGLDGHSDTHRGVKGYVWSGQWVPRCLELPHVRKVISFGVDKDLRSGIMNAPLGTPTHRIDLFLKGKFEMYPREMKGSTFYGRTTYQSDWVTMKPQSWFKTYAKWKPIKEWESVEAFAHYLLTRIPTDAIYLTLDKDGLNEEDCYSNYYGSGKQGTLSTKELVRILKVLKEHKNIVGIDTCGDFSVPAPPPTWLKKQWTKFGIQEFPKPLYNQPRLKKINEHTNLAILNTLV